MFKRLAVGLLGSVGLLGCEQQPHGSTGPVAVASAAPRRVDASALVLSATPGIPVMAPSVAAAQPAAPAASTSTEPPSLCNEQAAQPFLIEAHFDAHHAAGGTAREWKQVLARAVRYRTEQYGYVEGFGDEAWSNTTPSAEASVVTFFGVPVQLHRRVAPALACAEAAIKTRCADFPYQPYVLSGLRKRNTYLNGEISNHVYGIALDVDPTRNPCCGCVGGWRESKRCQNEKTKFERMEMPRCWVAEFERFGFYWLGNSTIEDTMHFEFLGDPSRIARGTQAE